MPTEIAKITFNQDGVPVSDRFDDIYFSNSDGLEETNYVFIKHNGLPQRWSEHNNEIFHIGETGFGTGLNFLAVWHAYNLFKDNKPDKLIFSSFEKFPMDKADLKQSLNAFPELSHLADEFVNAYPNELEGDIKLKLGNGKIELNIYLGDVNHRIDQQGTLERKVDAWFLDGFAPSKNPDMWQDTLFQALASNSSDNCTIATFTAAGFVRRGLIDAGFDMYKYKGFGHKREMIAGLFNQVRQS